MAELKDLLDERRKMVDKKATQHREIRDDWNEKTKTYTSTRNELNNEVRELIVQVREQRDLRDQMNEMEDIIDLGRRYGADRVWLNRITDWQTYSDFSWHDVVAPEHPEHSKFQHEFARIKTTDNYVGYATLE